MRVSGVTLILGVRVRHWPSVRIMTLGLARNIAAIISDSARTVLEQHNLRDGAADLARELGNNASQMIVLLIQSETSRAHGVLFQCVVCGSDTGNAINDVCEACHREIRISREKDGRHEERAR